MQPELSINRQHSRLNSICDCSSSILFERNLVLIKNINGSGGLFGFFGGQADQPGIRVPASFPCAVSGACRSQQQSKWLPSVSLSPVGCCESVKRHLQFNFLLEIQCLSGLGGCRWDRSGINVSKKDSKDIKYIKRCKVVGSLVTVHAAILAV